VRVLVTGSSGFLGALVVERLADEGHVPLACDLSEGAGDILSEFWEPPECDAVIHLAADKHAGNGEEHPARVADLNVRGTQHVVDRCAPARVVLASTCKAAAPVTAYGASKMIAERIVLNAGGTVVRLVNVIGSSGSVVQLWERDNGPLPVTDCVRMWIRPEDAARALVGALGLPGGRYAPAPRLYETMHVATLADWLFPGRETVPVPLRRGDRPVERLTNDYERTEPWGQYVRIYDAWERTPSGVQT
jgi:FlaA1/EpsC-like NDP-sugar epimerase